MSSVVQGRVRRAEMRLPVRLRSWCPRRICTTRSGAAVRLGQAATGSRAKIRFCPSFGHRDGLGPLHHPSLEPPVRVPARWPWGDLKIRIIMYAKVRQAIDFSTIPGDTILHSMCGLLALQRPDLFDGALPLSYVNFRLLKSPLTSECSLVNLVRSLSKFQNGGASGRQAGRTTTYECAGY